MSGTDTVARSAPAAGIGRLVHCSPIHAFDIRRCRDIDESAPRSGSRTAPYDRSKALGEDGVRADVAAGLDAVIVNPTGIIGPRDEAPSRMGTVLREFWHGRLPATSSGGFDWVDVRDVVMALRAAAQLGRTGENYLVGGHRCSVSHLLERAAAASGEESRLRVVPMWSLRLVSPFTTLAARRTGNPLLPTIEALAALTAFPRVNRAKATAELRYEPGVQLCASGWSSQRCRIGVWSAVVSALRAVTMSSASATGTPYRRASGTAMLDLPTPDAPQMSATIHEVLRTEAFTAPILADHRRRSSR